MLQCDQGHPPASRQDNCSLRGSLLPAGRLERPKAAKGRCLLAAAWSNLPKLLLTDYAGVRTPKGFCCNGLCRLTCWQAWKSCIQKCHPRQAMPAVPGQAALHLHVASCMSVDGCFIDRVVTFNRFSRPQLFLFWCLFLIRPLEKCGIVRLRPNACASICQLGSQDCMGLATCHIHQRVIWVPDL